MRNHEEITREVESRNDFRAEVGLPLVSVPNEVEKIYKAELWQDFLDWCKTYPLRDKIAEEVLQAARKERGDPAWVPRGVLSGGGLGYGHRVQERMRQIWREERNQQCG
jgi:hypothetical protein